MLKQCREWILVILAVELLIGSARAKEAPQNERVAIVHADQAMRVAAVDWLQTLNEKLRTQATFEYESSVRTDWHFIPKPRAGVSLGEMDRRQRQAAMALLESALSERGQLKAETIMSLELVLRQLESHRPQIEQIRDPEKYWFAVFGDPSSESDQPWGWRVEGHHLSLNFSSLETDLATTPLFLGANPAEVHQGPNRGLKALGDEDALGMRLMASLSASQQAKALLSDEAPREILGTPGASLSGMEPVGLPASEMDEAQQAKLRQIVMAFVGCLRAEFAEQEIAAMETAGFDRLCFSWAGPVESPGKHYFRVHGPTLMIEYDHVGANHVHAVWHDPQDDFGLRTLQRHYQQHAH